MKIFLHRSLEESSHCVVTSNALKSWYDSNPAVQRLWAIQLTREGGASVLRVMLMLQPSPDGDDTTPVWMARCAKWTLDLSQRLAGPVQLERIDGPLPDAFEVDGDGILLSALCWRDPTS